jgi:hypothetical protein
MTIVGYQSEVAKISAKIADIKAQLGQSGPKVTATGMVHAAQQKRRRTESEMGSAEKATGATSEAQEAGVVGRRFESHTGSQRRSGGQRTGKPRKARLKLTLGYSLCKKAHQSQYLA